MNAYLAAARRCIRCGLCLNSCPLSRLWPPVGEPGTPRGKMAVLRRVLEGDLGLDEAAQAEFWYRCTGCKACEAACPLGVPVVDLVVGARRLLVEQGKVPPEAARALASLRDYGNPWRRPPAERAAWAADRGVRVLGPEEGAETLLYLGCLAGYDARAGAAARALTSFLAAAGVDFAVLGPEEVCCGREVYSLGEEGLFARLVEENLGRFRRHGVRRLVAFSPHCYDAFKNLYPAFAEVGHYTEFLADLVREGRLVFRTGPVRRVTFHDPCHLARHNGATAAPRALLDALPGVEVLEVAAEREKGFCCGGGGGHMWLAAPAGGRALCRELLLRAAGRGAEVLAVACPLCLVNLEDAALALGPEAVPRVLDLAELLTLYLVREAGAWTSAQSGP